MANSKISALTSATTPLAGTETLPVVQSSTTKQVSVANLTAGRAVQMSSLDANGGSSTGGVILSGTISAVRASSTVLDIGDGNRYLALGANTSTPGLIKLISASSNASIYQYILTSDTSYNVTFNTGNLVQGTAAKGVNFTANTPAAGKTSQLLNWYEEGTFTPAFIADTTNPTVTYTTQSGSYTRIGNTVTFAIALVVNTISGGTGALRVSGLPFTNSSGLVWAANRAFVYNWLVNPTVFQVSNSSNTVLIYTSDVSNTTATPASLQASSYFYISGTYKVS